MFDSLWRKADCPACRQPDARVLLWMVKCRNTICRHFDTALHQTPTGPQAGIPSAGGALPASPTLPVGPQTASLFSRLRMALSTTFDPGEDAIEIRYRNHKGEEKTFRADKTTLRVSGRHVTVCVAPTGQRIALARDRITNLQAVEPSIPPGPYPDKKERRVLLHGDPCSARYEEVEKKFPDWE